MNILETNKNIDIIEKSIAYLQYYPPNEQFIINLLSYLLPSDNSIITYEITSQENRICFSPILKQIIISLPTLKKWLAKNRELILIQYNLQNISNKYIKILDSYLTLYIIIHEIEHCYQYLIAKDQIANFNPTIKEGYNILFTKILANQDKNIHQRIIAYHYFQNENNYLLERNANIETCLILKNIAIRTGNITIAKIINDLLIKNILIGYQKNENYRLGLTITKEKRYQLLKSEE